MQVQRLGAGVFALAMACAGTATAQPFDIPRLDAITIDGDRSDWGDRGFRVDTLHVESETPGDDVDARARLGWDERGLLLWFEVRDDAAHEGPESALWSGDSIETFISPRVGVPGYQVIFAPGAGETHPALRTQVFRRDSALGETPIPHEAARRVTEDGYTLEVLLPWAPLEIEPAVGVEVAFQFYVNDQDADNGRRIRSHFHPRADTHADAHRMHPLALAEAPSPAVSLAVAADYDRWLGGIDFTVRASGRHAGQTVTITQEGVGEVASLALPSTGDRLVGRIRTPMPPAGAGDVSFTVSVDDEKAVVVTLPSADARRARALAELAVRAEPSVFGSETFPAISFEQPIWAERVLGRSTIKTTFYNASGEPVETAEQPGRYGAVVTITDERGREHTRRLTLFRQAEETRWYEDGLGGEVTLPAAWGVDPQVVREQQSAVLGQLGWALGDQAERNDHPATLLAGLAEMERGGDVATQFDDHAARDRAWWLTLSRKLNGNAERFTRRFEGPAPIEGTPARTLREGTAEEAGMASDAVERIDAVLSAWAADTDEPFIACVVRHGVIVLHKAYGTRNGEPMTVHTPSYMASLTKLIHGTALMMLVDRGMMSLDDPVDRYFPELQGIEVETRPTIHHLMTHTAGMWDHWADWDSTDLEHRVADVLPHLTVGRRHEYNGMSLALAGKAMEQVTGEPLPTFYRDHLIVPLGMADTEVSQTATGAMSTALDMAKLGQMLLNGGAYGDRRYFSEETRDAMLPRQLDTLLGPDTTMNWGVGCTWQSHDGLSERTFGHGAASSATLRIDLENDLIISMTRNGAGRNFGVYHPQFIRTVVECLVH